MQAKVKWKVGSYFSIGNIKLQKSIFTKMEKICISIPVVLSIYVKARPYKALLYFW